MPQNEISGGEILLKLIFGKGENLIEHFRKISQKYISDQYLKKAFFKLPFMCII